MMNKLWFLTKNSLNKKIKTKWFLIANLIFMLLIVGLINIDSIIKAFGGDFNETQEIIVIDNAEVFDKFKDNYLLGSKYISEYDDVNIVKYDKSYDEGIVEVEDNKKLLLVIDKDNDNYIKAKLVSKEAIGTITNTIINTALKSVRSEIALSKYNIGSYEYDDINKNVMIENITLSDDKNNNTMLISSFMQIITLPMFMLIIFLVQMIGAEVNEEKSTKSMEIIISNVSPRVHFMSKVIAANVFVLLQGLMLIVFSLIGIFIRYLIGGNNLIGSISSEVSGYIDISLINSMIKTFSYMIPLLIIIMILTFIAYSLLAGILASMTTNLEDFQQLQTPIVVISLVGYYLSAMAGMFKGSVFIHIMSYIPFVSSMLAPTLYVIGEINLYDLLLSIGLLIFVIYLLIKYGLRIYKVGILNYSGTGLWKKMFKAVKGK